MHKVILISAAVVLMLCGAAFAEMAPIQVGSGTMQIGVVFQPLFTYYVGQDYLVWDDNVKDLRVMKRPQSFDFSISRARIILSGEAVESHIEYLFQVDFAGKLSFDSSRKYLTDVSATKNDDGLISDIDTKSASNFKIVKSSGYAPQLLDLKLSFKYIPYTSINIGRYLPQFTYFGPQSTAKLVLIDYPLLNQFLGVQRQTGLDIFINTKYVQFDIGAWTGRFFSFRNPDIATNKTGSVDDRGTAPGITADSASYNPIYGKTVKTVGNAADSFGDENTEKDISARLVVKPINELEIFGDFWFGRPLEYLAYHEGNRKEHDDNVYVATGGVAYKPDFGLTFIAEGMWAKMKWDRKKYHSPFAVEDGPVMQYDKAEESSIVRNKDFTSVTAMSAYAMAGFNFKSVAGIPVELVFRFDYLDPDTSDKKLTFGTLGKDKDGSEIKNVSQTLNTSEDAVTAISGGVNYYIKDWIMLYLDYIHQDEEARYLTHDFSNTVDRQRGMLNDQIKFQAQVAF